MGTVGTFWLKYTHMNSLRAVCLLWSITVIMSPCKISEFLLQIYVVQAPLYIGNSINADYAGPITADNFLLKQLVYRITVQADLEIC